MHSSLFFFNFSRTGDTVLKTKKIIICLCKESQVQVEGQVHLTIAVLGL